MYQARLARRSNVSGVKLRPPMADRWHSQDDRLLVWRLFRFQSALIRWRLFRFQSALIRWARLPQCRRERIR